MAVVYGVICVLALALLMAYSFVYKHKNRWLELLFVSVFVYSIGYFVISLSKTKWLALLGNSISYLGSVFLPLLLLMLVVELCKISINKKLFYFCFGIGIVMLFLTISPWFSNLFYKDFELQFVGGSAIMIKQYGALHPIYAVYLIAYFVAMLVIVIVKLNKKDSLEVRKHAMFILCVLVGNLCIWVIEKIIHSNFEFLTISYIITESLLMYLYSIIDEYDKKLDSIKPVLDTISPDVSLKIKGFSEDEIKCIKENWQLILLLTEKEKEILSLILKNEKRKDIANKLYISENTVKKHTASIFKKLKVESREELFYKSKIYLSKN